MPKVYSQLRYSVASAVFETKTVEKTKYIILDDGIPSVEINKHLVIKQEKYARPVSSDAYNLRMFLNSINENEMEICDVTMNDIYSYLYSAFVDDCKSYRTVLSYISSISALYESLARRHYNVDESIFRPDSRAVLFSGLQSRIKVLKNSHDRLTMINTLRYEFSPRKTDAPQSSYMKWYGPEEISAISTQLPLVYRCIFLDTIFTGHRVDSALSLTLDSVNLRESKVIPTRTKTGKKHISLIPQMLSNLMQTYQLECRRQIVEKTGSTDNCFYLGRDGKPVSYGAYDKALKAAGERVHETNPDFNLQVLRSHAGRSTFAATLRSYQLKLQREGLKTFSDVDFCNLMDWKSLQCLQNYDIQTRAQEVSPLLEKFFSEYMEIAQINRSK